MSYTPPASNALEFTFQGGAYVPPSAAGVDLAFADASTTHLNCAGGITVAGEVALAPGESLSASGSISVSGAADIVYSKAINLVGSVLTSVYGDAEIMATVHLAAFGAIGPQGAAWLDRGTVFQAAEGSVSVTGAASLRAEPRLTGIGRIAVTGEADLLRGQYVTVSATVKMGGFVRANAGKTFSCLGSIPVRRGSASILHGKTLTANGQIAVRGGGVLATAPTLSFGLAGGISVSGLFQIASPRKKPLGGFFIKTDRQEIFINGV